MNGPGPPSEGSDEEEEDAPILESTQEQGGIGHKSHCIPLFTTHHPLAPRGFSLNKLPHPSHF